jgi:hypothetical protein
MKLRPLTGAEKGVIALAVLLVIGGDPHRKSQVNAIGGKQ